MTRVQQGIVQILKDHPTYHIEASPYEHLQLVTDGVGYTGDNRPFRKYFYKATLRRLLKEGIVSVSFANGEYSHYKLSQEATT